ncbi:MAG: hypothetical protein AAF380_01975 [Bacteroidota bacterium]
MINVDRYKLQYKSAKEADEIMESTLREIIQSTLEAEWIDQESDLVKQYGLQYPLTRYVLDYVLADENKKVLEQIINKNSKQITSDNYTINGAIADVLSLCIKKGIPIDRHYMKLNKGIDLLYSNLRLIHEAWIQTNHDSNLSIKLLKASDITRYKEKGINLKPTTLGEIKAFGEKWKPQTTQSKKTKADANTTLKREKAPSTLDQKLTSQKKKTNQASGPHIIPHLRSRCYWFKHNSSHQNSY